MAEGEPPLVLDGTRVLQYAALAAKPGQGSGSVVEGVALSVTQVAIAEDLARGGVFLLHCNDNWETLAASHFATHSGAEETAAASYPGIEWTPFRALTEAEQKEVDTTRQFLRDLAAEFPSD